MESFVSVFPSVAEWLATLLDNLTQFAGKFTGLTNGILRVLQKLLKSFNGTAVSTFFV